MAALDRASLLRRTMPTATLALPDGQDAYSSQGAAVLMGIEQQIERHEKTTLAITALKAAPALAEGAGLLTSLAKRSGVRLATRYGALAVPVVGEAVGGAMLAYDTWRFGYRAITGRDFDETSVGKAVTRASNGAWHAGLSVAGGALDILGMHEAASLSRGFISEVITGTPVAQSAAIPTPVPTPAAPTTPHLRLPPHTSHRAAAANDHPQTSSPQPATAPPPPAASPTRNPPSSRVAVQDWDNKPAPQPVITMREGPTKPMGASDWHEPQYGWSGKTATLTTTPLSRAYATMDMLVADAGIERPRALPTPDLSAAPARATPSRAQADGMGVG